jgi:hypothetical protein
VLTERLPPVSVDGEIPNLRSGDQNVNFAAQNSEAATMEIDNENGADNNRSVWYSGCTTHISTKPHFLALPS